MLSKKATYYLQSQVFYFNSAEENSAIVRVFPLEDYYKLDPDNKMETYEFGIIYCLAEPMSFDRITKLIGENSLVKYFKKKIVLLALFYTF